MEAFVAGATGVLGRRLVQQFRSGGHTVLGLTRSDAGDRTVRSFGGEPRRGDLFDTEGLARAAKGADVVVHAATAIPTKVRTKPSDWAMNDRIRREGTRALTSAAAKVGARLYIQQSVVWLASPPDGSPFDEDAPPRPDRVLASSLEGETIAREAGERHGFQSAILRCGLFYASDAAHIRSFGEGLLRRRMPLIGRGDATWSLIHVDDAASAFVTTAEAMRGGLWHIVDDRPATMSEVLTGLATRLGAPPPRRAPRWLARLAAGREAFNFLTSSFRASNARFRRDLGWAPRYPTFEQGLDQVVAAWRAEGYPRARG